jgi:transposase
MDVHKESIDITLAESGGEVRRLGAIGGDRGSLLKMVRKQQSRGGQRVFVYEAGPCGFWIYREITALGHRCMVVSPSLIPRRSGDHVKTDRRDSERVTRIIATRQTGLPKAACDIAWRAQLRLSAKYRRLAARQVNHNKIVVALARELAGFVWAIGQSVKPL